MGYRKRRKNTSNFASYCHSQLTRVKKAKKASSRSKATLNYQKCLTTKHGIKTGIKIKKKQ